MKKLLILLLLGFVTLITCKKDPDKRKWFNDLQNEVYDTYQVGDKFTLASEKDTETFVIDEKETYKATYIFPNYERIIRFKTDSGDDIHQYHWITMFSGDTVDIEFEIFTNFRCKQPDSIPSIYDITYVNNGFYCVNKNKSFSDTLFWENGVGIVKVNIGDTVVYNLIK